MDFDVLQEMKSSTQRDEAFISAEDWYRLAQANFPEIDLADSDSALSTKVCCACEDLAYLADNAHETSNDDGFLTRCYGFIRWSIRNTDDEKLKGWIADWFFDRLLDLPSAKVGCLEYLDWGDVKLLSAEFTVEPGFDDVENFERLCSVWKRRWGRNQKLKPPTKPAEQAAAPNRSAAPSLNSEIPVRGSEG